MTFQCFCHLHNGRTVAQRLTSKKSYNIAETWLIILYSALSTLTCVGYLLKCNMYIRVHDRRTLSILNDMRWLKENQTGFKMHSLYNTTAIPF
jgi:hypothetical protein